MGVFTSGEMSTEKPGLCALVSAEMLRGIITTRFRFIGKSRGRASAEGEPRCARRELQTGVWCFLARIDRG